MPLNSKRYSKDEIDFICSNYDKLSVKEIAQALNRSPKGIRNKIEALKLPLCTLNRNKPYDWSDYEITYIKEHYKTMSDAKMGKALNLSHSMVCRKRLELGLNNHKYEPFIAGEYVFQYVDGKRICLHRAAMEKKIGRKLTKSERVHHIDGNKTNYDPNNLYLCKDRSEHMLVHSSLEKVAFELFRQGIIKFDPISGKYYF